MIEKHEAKALANEASVDEASPIQAAMRMLDSRLCHLEHHSYTTLRDKLGMVLSPSVPVEDDNNKAMKQASTEMESYLLDQVNRADLLIQAFDDLVRRVEL